MDFEVEARCVDFALAVGMGRCNDFGLAVVLETALARVVLETALARVVDGFDGAGAGSVDLEGGPNTCLRDGRSESLSSSSGTGACCFADFDGLAAANGGGGGR